MRKCVNAEFTYLISIYICQTCVVWRSIVFAACPRVQKVLPSRGRITLIFLLLAITASSAKNHPKQKVRIIIAVSAETHSVLKIYYFIFRAQEEQCIHL